MRARSISTCAKLRMLADRALKCATVFVTVVSPPPLPCSLPSCAAAIEDDMSIQHPISRRIGEADQDKMSPPSASTMVSSISTDSTLTCTRSLPASYADELVSTNMKLSKSLSPHVSRASPVRLATNWFHAMRLDLTTQPQCPFTQTYSFAPRNLELACETPNGTRKPISTLSIFKISRLTS